MSEFRPNSADIEMVGQSHAARKIDWLNEDCEFCGYYKKSYCLKHSVKTDEEDSACPDFKRKRFALICCSCHKSEVFDLSSDNWKLRFCVGIKRTLCHKCTDSGLSANE